MIFNVFKFKTNKGLKDMIAILPNFEFECPQLSPSGLVAFLNQLAYPIKLMSDCSLVDPFVLFSHGLRVCCFSHSCFFFEAEGSGAEGAWFGLEKICGRGRCRLVSSCDSGVAPKKFIQKNLNPRVFLSYS